MFNRGPEQYFDGQQLYAARAISDGDAKRLRAVVRPGEIDQPGKKGMTLLWWAIHEKQFEAISVLISLGSKPDEQVVQGLGTPLRHALGVEDLRFLTAMLDGGLPVDRLDSNQETILYLAAGPNGRLIEHVKLLVERGADVNIAVPNGETALFSAIFTVRLDCALYLVEHGAKLDVSTVNGVTPGWPVYQEIRDQKEGSAMRRRYEQLRDAMIAKGAKWPPDPPEQVRVWMRTQGMRVVD